MKVVLVTGGFDPLHSGHIAYFNAAKKLGDKLIVGVNSDAWLSRKKGRSFMPVTERTAIVDNIKCVDGVILFNDDDGSAKEAIRNVRQMFPDDTIVFANGGDRTSVNIPEMNCGVDNVEFIFGVGGEDKKNSSSWILEEWKTPKTQRAWGYYRVLDTWGKNVKLKELTVNPKTCLSMQRHEKRAEFWFVAEGQAAVYTLDAGTDEELKCYLSPLEHTWIQTGEWHMLCNETGAPLKVVEIQFGDDCVEEDIQRVEKK